MNLFDESPIFTVLEYLSSMPKNGLLGIIIGVYFKKILDKLFKRAKIAVKPLDTLIKWYRTKEKTEFALWKGEAELAEVNSEIAFINFGGRNATITDIEFYIIYKKLSGNLVKIDISEFDLRIKTENFLFSSYEKYIHNRFEIPSYSSTILNVQYKLKRTGDYSDIFNKGEMSLYISYTINEGIRKRRTKINHQDYLFKQNKALG